MSEVLKDVFIPFYERLKRPFLGAFWVSWFFVNWKLWVALLFYGRQVNGMDKIWFIQEHLTQSVLIWEPFKYACGFLLIMPVMDYVAFYWQQIVRREKKTIKLKFEGKTPVNPELHLKVVEEREEWKAKMAKLEGKYADIQKRADRMKEESNKYKELILEPTISYFLGNWHFTTPFVHRWILRFEVEKLIIFREALPKGRSEIALSELTNDSEHEERIIELLHVYRPFRAGEHVILPVKPLSSDTADTEAGIMGATHTNDNVRLSPLFSRDIVYLRIGVSGVTEISFGFVCNGQGESIYLERLGDYNNGNALFPVADRDVYQLPPGKRANLQWQ